MKTKKILIFTNHFLPGNRAGGPVTSIANLSQLLNNDFEIIIVTSNKDLGIETPYENIEYNKLLKYQTFNVIYLSEINQKSIMNVIDRNSIDIIYLNSFFSTFTQLVLTLLIKNNFKIPIILAPRGELQKNALAIKAVKKKIYLFLYTFFKLYKKVYFHATDVIEYNSIKKMFPIEKITTLANVPKQSNYQPLNKDKNSLKLIFISRIRDNKNLLFSLNALSICKGDIIFDIYGPIEDENYWKDCQKAINKFPKNIVVAYKGVVNPIDISKTMQQYHGLLLPTKTENFGHVIVEAMQSGVVPIISNQTPWVELQKYNAGWDLSLKDGVKFTEAIDILYKMDYLTYHKLSENTIQYINKKLNTNELKIKYINFFKGVIDNEA